MASWKLPDTREELEIALAECQRRLALFAKYDDTVIAKLQATPELSGIGALQLRTLLDAVGKVKVLPA